MATAAFPQHSIDDLIRRFPEFSCDPLGHLSKSASALPNAAYSRRYVYPTMRTESDETVASDGDRTCGRSHCTPESELLRAGEGNMDDRCPPIPWPAPKLKSCAGNAPTPSASRVVAPRRQTPPENVRVQPCIAWEWMVHHEEAHTPPIIAVRLGNFAIPFGALPPVPSPKHAREASPIRLGAGAPGCPSCSLITEPNWPVNRSGEGDHMIISPLRLR
jgi:hypothetical protein